MQEMDKKSLAVILDSIRHSLETIWKLALDPYSDCQDADLKKMYHDLSNMYLKVYGKLKEKEMTE